MNSDSKRGIDRRRLIGWGGLAAAGVVVAGVPLVSAPRRSCPPGSGRPSAISVLRIEDGRIVEITAFHDLGLFPAFALPLALPLAHR